MTSQHRAHVTAEWATGRVTIQVAHDLPEGRALGYMALGFSATEVPRLERAYVPAHEGAVAEESERRGHAPGFSLNEDDAVLVWEALDEYLHNTGTHPTKALLAAEQRANDAELALTIATERLAAMEQLSAEQAGHRFTLEDTLARDRQTVDLERAREAAAQEGLQGLSKAYQELQAQAARMMEAQANPLLRVDDGLCLHQAPDGFTLCAERRGHREALGNAHRAAENTWDDDGRWITRSQ